MKRCISRLWFLVDSEMEKLLPEMSITYNGRLVTFMLLLLYNTRFTIFEAFQRGLQFFRPHIRCLLPINLAQ